LWSAWLIAFARMKPALKKFVKDVLETEANRQVWERYQNNFNWDQGKTLTWLLIQPTKRKEVMSGNEPLT